MLAKKQFRTNRTTSAKSPAPATPFQTIFKRGDLAVRAEVVQE